jgi:glycosyltransferase involved in cell wall biosynthesis
MQPELTIIIPCYNESQTIREVIQRVLDLPIEKQVIVVDDGSTDGTAEIVRELANSVRRSGRIETLIHDSNHGKGFAVRSGLKLARGRYTIVQDADLEYDPRDILPLLDRIREEPGIVVYGARHLHQPGQRRRLLDSGISAINRIAAAVYGVRLRDIMTCYKLLPTDVMKTMDLRCEGFEFCTEMTAKASRMGLRIVEVPITYQPRSRDAGKKVRFHHGPSVAYALWKYRKWNP